MTIEQIKSRSEETGHRWFDRETSRFWSTRYHAHVYAAHAPGVYYFVTSDKTGDPRVRWNYDGTRRLYNVRRFDWQTGETTTMGEFGLYTTRRQAHAIARSFANER